MAQSDLGILIKAWLDDSTSGINDLNNQITKLANNPALAKLKLSVDIDTKTLNNLQKQVENIQSKLTKQGVNGVTLIDLGDLRQQGKEYFDSIDKVLEKYGELGKVKLDKQFDPATKELQSFVLELEKGNGIVEKLKFNLNNTLDGDKVGKAFVLDSVKEIDKTADAREKALSNELSLRQTIVRQEEQQAQKQRQYAQDYENWWLKALKERELKQNQLESQESRRVSNLGFMKLDGISDSAFTGDYNKVKANMDAYIKSIYGVDAELIKLSRSFDKNNNELWKFTTNVQTGKDTFNQFNGTIDKTTKAIYDNGQVTQHTMARNLSVWEQFKIAASRIPVWMAGMTAK